jgi:type II secretory pathway pseudopilin PulG
MIVMVVLGVLGGIVLFGVANFQAGATRTRDEGNARQCATAMESYRTKHAGADPVSWSQISEYLASVPAGACGLAP